HECDINRDMATGKQSAKSITESERLLGTKWHQVVSIIDKTDVNSIPCFPKDRQRQQLAIR
ncbi:hypothetical protein ACJMK2_033446, partial [Sinanodonta woodiana]